MNKVKIFFIALVGLGIVSCETMPDPEVEYSPVFPLSGEYIVSLYTSDTLYDYGYSLRTYNVSSNRADSLWIRLFNSSEPFGVLTKTGCDVKALSFSIENGVNFDSPITIHEGKVILKGASVKPSGVQPDSFYMRYTYDGIEWIAAGYRRTGWPQDEMY